MAEWVVDETYTTKRLFAEYEYKIILAGAGVGTGEKMAFPSMPPAIKSGGLVIKKYKPGGFYWKRELYQSDAFLSLGKNSIKVLIALLGNRQREKTNAAKDKKGNKRKSKFINLDRLEVPYGTLEKVYRINRSSIPAAFDKLLAKGFIKISYHGGACKHDKNKYAWSDKYLLWTPASAPFEVRPKREKHGYQGRRIGATRVKRL